MAGNLISGEERVDWNASMTFLWDGWMDSLCVNMCVDGWVDRQVDKWVARWMVGV